MSVATEVDGLPPGYSLCGEAYCQHSEGGDGGDAPPYVCWIRSAKALHATPPKVLSAAGDSGAEATRRLTRKCWADYHFRNLPDLERLDKLLDAAKVSGRFYGSELVDVISIIATRLKQLGR